MVHEALALIMPLASAKGIRVEVTAEPVGEGSTFVFSLPVAARRDGTLELPTR